MKRLFRSRLWTKLITGSIKTKLIALLGIVFFLVVAGTMIGMFVFKLKTGDALWWSWTHVLDPGFLGDDKDDRSRQLWGSVFSTMGLVLIGGAFITLAEEAAKRTVENLMHGRVPKDISGHTVIAGKDSSKIKAYIDALNSLADNPSVEKMFITVPDQESLTLARTICGHPATLVVGQLESLNLKNAKRIILLENSCGNNGDTLNQINSIYENIKDRLDTENPLEIYVEVNNRDLATTLRIAINRLDRNCNGINLHILNVADASARLVLKKHPLDCLPVLPGSSSRVTLVIEGWTKFAQALFWQALRVAHYPVKPTRIVVYHPDAERIENEVFAVAPGLKDEWCCKQLVEVIFAASFSPEDFGITEQDIVTYAICSENVDLGFAHALQRQETPFAGLLQIYLELPGGSGYRDVIQKIAPCDNENGGVKLVPVGPSDEAIDFEEKLDASAKKLHERYLQQRISQGKRIITPNGSYKDKSDYDWSDLDETRRAWNRASVDHIEVKLRALADFHKIGGRLQLNSSTGFDALREKMEEIVAIGCSGNRPDLETLSKIEHDRWSAEKIAEGWMYSEITDKNRKQSAYLQPYDQLTEEIKGYDREAVIEIMKNLIA